jgi:hypothetical protein
MKYTIYSTGFLNSLVDDSLGYISHRVWLQKIDEGFDRIFANIEFANGLKRICALQGIQEDNMHENAIYLPMWMIPHGVEIGDEVDFDIFDKSAFPEALHIVLKPLDSVFYNVNEVRQELSHALTKMGVLVEGEIVKLNLEENDVLFYVSRLEPANICLMDGEEVSIEFEESADRWDGRPPTPPPAQPERLIPDYSNQNSMLPQQEPENKWVGEGNKLGGLKKTMPDGRPWNPWRESKLGLPKEDRK